MRPLVAHCHLALANLDNRTGRSEQAHRNLTAAMSMYREMNMQQWLRRSEAEAAHWS